MIKKGLLIMIALIVMSGCSEQTGSKQLYDTISRLEQLINENDIPALKKEADSIRQAYQKNLWKLQLIGDEGEYEGLNQGISRFIAATEIEDIESAKMELASIKSYLEDIYSL